MLDELKLDRELLESIGSSPDEELFQASMGIYVFNRQVLVDCLEQRPRRFRQTRHPARRSASGMSTPTFSMATGKTSERSALSTRRIST